MVFAGCTLIGTLTGSKAGDPGPGQVNSPLAAGSHSGAWLTVAMLEDVFVFIGDEGGTALSPSQLTWAVEAARQAGLPNQFTIFIGNHTIGEGTPAVE